MNNRKQDVSKAQNERHRQILQVLLKQEDNRRCADCQARGPTWASVNLGVFVCLNCSGHHRSLGVHISKVRSATLDTWLPEQVSFVQQMGNRRANEFWEASLPKDFRRPAEGDMAALAVFIGDKYRNQAYVSREFREPPTIDNFRDHPFMARGAGAAAANVAGEASAAQVAPASRVDAAPPPASPSPTQVRATTTPPPKPQPDANLFDLLQLDEPAQKPAEGRPQRAAAGLATLAAEADGGWAAWDTSEAPQATTQASSRATPPPPSDAAALVAATGLVDEWDAFQSGSAPQDGPTPRSSDDPFASSGSLEDPFAAGFKAFPEVAAAPARTSLKAPPAIKSHDDILKMFDSPSSLGGPEALGGFISAIPPPSIQTPMFRAQGVYPNGAAVGPTPVPLGFPPTPAGLPSASLGPPANFAGLQLHAAPLAGASPLRDPFSAMPYQNVAPNSAARPGSLY